GPAAADAPHAAGGPARPARGRRPGGVQSSSRLGAPPRPLSADAPPRERAPRPPARRAAARARGVVERPLRLARCRRGGLLGPGARAARALRLARRLPARDAAGG